ncbi:hypothetical protein BASA61_005202 [Batrachochytrium salamandrivorans]|nr:hypothetical protein BASA61_005202 [Batrachochytrium salamandrivorans]
MTTLDLGDGAKTGETVEVEDEDEDTRTEETVELKPESGANLKTRAACEYGPFGSDVVTAGGKSEDEVTGPETNTETEETVEFKPESGADDDESTDEGTGPEKNTDLKMIIVEESGTKDSEYDTENNQLHVKVTNLR